MFYNLLKIKSIVTILLIGTLVAIILLKIEVNESVMALFTTAVGAVIASLFAKKDSN